MNINEQIMTMDNTGGVVQNKVYIWKREEEELLREWADKAQCFRWLHTKAHEKYRWINAYFTIPVIILSTLTGAANFSQDKVPSDKREMVILIIGSVNIIAGIISTIAQYLKVAEINEGHRISSISWGKFSRKLKVELARHPSKRSSPDELIKSTKDEYDRMVEISPPIPEKIISRFMTEVIDKKISEQKEGSRSAKRAEKKNKLELQLPEICGEINTTKIYSEGTKQYDDYESETPSIVLQKQIQEVQKINEYKKSFSKIHGRDPTDFEVKTNMDSKINLPMSSIVNIDSGAGVSNMLQRNQGNNVNNVNTPQPQVLNTQPPNNNDQNNQGAGGFTIPPINLNKND